MQRARRPAARLRLAWVVAWMVVLTVLGLLVMDPNAAISDGYRAWLQDPLLSTGFPLDGLLRRFYYQFFVGSLASPLFWLLLAGVLAIERLSPARSEQPSFSTSLAFDFIGFATHAFFYVFLISFELRLLERIYDRYFDFLTIRGLETLPSGARFVIAVIVGDFVMWLHHWIRHRVPLFWDFHVIHHSQRNMNPFTNFRGHPVDFAILHAVVFLPTFAFQLSQPQALAFPLIIYWYTTLQHSNVRWTFGPLRAVLVTPQSHRLHHSVEPRHQDINYGTLFCVWDRIFGTHRDEPEALPDTGISDPDFPHEESGAPLALVVTVLRQLAYPFGRAGRRLLGRPVS